MMIPRFEPTTSLGETLVFLADSAFGSLSDRRDVERFEQEFAAWQGAGEALFVPSGRMGLWLILKALGYPEESEIIVPSFTYFAIPAIIRFAGLRPVYADIDPATHELTAGTVAPLLTSKTRALLPTHLFGRTAPMTELQALADQHNLDILEDCAQSCGARCGEVRTGSVGRAAYFTFGITKNFSTFSGGMVVSRDDSLMRSMAANRDRFADSSRSYLIKQGLTAAAMSLATRRVVFNISLSPLVKLGKQSDADPVHKSFEEQIHEVTGDVMTRLKWRPGDPQAKAGLRQLTVVDAKNRLRRQKGNALLAALTARGAGGLPAGPDKGGDHIFVSFAIRRTRRTAFGALLRRAGIDFSPGYMSACSAVPELGGKPALCPQGEAAEREIVHLPLYPGLSTRDIQSIADGVAWADAQLGGE